LTPDELQKIEGFMKQYIRNPKIDPPYDKLPQYAQRVRLWALQQPKNYAQDDDYMAEISARMYAQDQAQEHPLGKVKLIVLTRDKNKHDYQGPLTASLVKEHEEQQARMTKLSSDGRQIIVPNSGHQIELEAPDKVVAAIHDITGYQNQGDKIRGQTEKIRGQTKKSGDRRNVPLSGIDENTSCLSPDFPPVVDFRFRTQAVGAALRVLSRGAPSRMFAVSL
jgi:hypothetical protein